MKIELSQVEFTERLILKNGGKWDLWVSYNQVVEKFAKEHKIEPLRPEQLPAIYEYSAELQVTLQKERKLPYFPPIPFPGGLRFPHLHIEGRIYPLTQDQWKEFTGVMIKDLSTRLSNARTVSFNGLMEITESIGALG